MQDRIKQAINMTDDLKDFIKEYEEFNTKQQEEKSNTSSDDDVMAPDDDLPF